MPEPIYQDDQIVRQLEARKGGYFYVIVPAEIVAQMPKKRATRLICSLNSLVSFSCGLNHLGDGNFFIILSKNNLERTGSGLGDRLAFELSIDPNPLGVEIPEVLKVLLEQVPELKSLFEALSDGKKRNIIHSINKIKNVDLQINRATKLICEANIMRKKRS